MSTASTHTPTGPSTITSADASAFAPPKAANKAIDVGDAISGGMGSSSEPQGTLKALTTRLKETYRKANPERPVGCDAAPRRVLTHPSFPVSNGCA